MINIAQARITTDALVDVLKIDTQARDLRRLLEDDRIPQDIRENLRMFAIGCMEQHSWMREHMHKLQPIVDELERAATYQVVWDGMEDGRQRGKLEVPAHVLEALIGKSVKILEV